MAENEQTLKPCPFCGGEGEEISHTASIMNPRNYWAIRCTDCGAIAAPAWHPKGAIKNWNRRATCGGE